MASRVCAFDWGCTALGPMAGWPPPLRATVDMMLGHGFPMILLWGSELIQIYNDGYAQILQDKHPAALGQRTADCWPEVWHINGPIYQRVRQGETVTYTDKLYPLQRASGLEDTWFTITYSPVGDGESNILGVLVTMFDTSTGKRADRARNLSEAALRSSQKRLEQALSEKLESLVQLTGGVAHDFNNLLMVFNAGLDMLERSTDPERRERLTRSMRQAAQRGASLTRQLLAYSRSQALRRETVALPDLLDGMAELLGRSLPPGVQLRVQLPPGLWPLLVDPSELELALLNLAGNASDAMAGNGTLTISAENLEGSSTPAGDGGQVRITVSDTGCGMPEQIQARVFEPFFTTKDVGKGSGLGLAQVHGFATQSGGQVGIDSIVGQGTRISLVLPRAVPVAPPQTGTAVADGNVPETSGHCVLLVEDDAEVAALVQEMLCSLGHQVIHAACAKAALGALANDRRIDLVFSDIMMPGGINGVQLAAEVAQRRPGLPLLLTSGYSGSARNEAEALGIRILAKPYGIAELRAALAAALSATG